MLFNKGRVGRPIAQRVDFYIGMNKPDLLTRGGQDEVRSLPN